jgi:hypothetical protein
MNWTSEWSETPVPPSSRMLFWHDNLELCFLVLLNPLLQALRHPLQSVLIDFFEPLFHFVKTHHHAQVLRETVFVLFFKSFLITCFRSPMLVPARLHSIWICQRFLHEFTNTSTWILALAVQPILLNEAILQQRSICSIQWTECVAQLNGQEQLPIVWSVPTLVILG